MILKSMALEGVGGCRAAGEEEMIVVALAWGYGAYSAVREIIAPLSDVFSLKDFVYLDFCGILNLDA